MTLREHFEAIERKLDQLLGLVHERETHDSLDWATETARQTEELLAEVKKRDRARAVAWAGIRVLPVVRLRPSVCWWKRTATRFGAR
jgi:hypothetical protein